jgi:hypothetical protein
LNFDFCIFKQEVLIMATQAQIIANRRNAQKSTGPQTPQGKALASQNSLKHGLLARRNVITTESQEEFDLHRDTLLNELDPQTPMESMLADRIVSLSWRLKRADLIQNQTFDALHEESTAKPFPALTRLLTPENQDPDLILGRIALKDFSNERVLDRLLMYERRIEHSLFKTMQELQRLTLIRNMQPQQEQSTTNDDEPPTMNNELQTIMQNEPNFKMGKMPVSTVAPKPYPDKRRTINDERHPKRTQSNPTTEGSPEHSRRIQPKLELRSTMSKVEQNIPHTEQQARSVSAGVSILTPDFPLADTAKTTTIAAIGKTGSGPDREEQLPSG